MVAILDEAVDKARPGTLMLTLKLSLGKRFNFCLLGVVLLILAAGVTASLIAGYRGADRLTKR
jgi:hypothetical protein